MEIGKVGIWTAALGLRPLKEAREAAAGIEAMGYSTLWIPSMPDGLLTAALLLSATERINVATGIASIWTRDAMTMAGGQSVLARSFPGRFLLGLGVSHAPIVAMGGHTYERPYTAMRQYLERMDSAPLMASSLSIPPLRVLAALGPKMLRLAAERAAGAHPYFVPPEHTRYARKIMGEGPILAPEQAVVLETDPVAARQVARGHMRIYLGLPNYTNNLRRLGFGDDDFQDGGSDRLVDAIVAWGDADAIARRVREHHAAGADHVCLQVLSSDPRGLPFDEWRALAPALGLNGR